jgi:hypothetical protein
VTPALFCAILVLTDGALATEGSSTFSHSAAIARAASSDIQPPEADSVKQALGSREYPWYDSKADRVRPMWPAPWRKALANLIERVVDWLSRWFRPIGGQFAGLPVGTVILIAVLASILIALIVLWVREGSRVLSWQSDRERLGQSARLAHLPEGLRPGSDDPWAEALRRREAGDLAGAIVCVFAHQLLALDQDGLIRLVPGRTGRQYVQGLRDADLHDLLGGTLGLFEEVYYGGRRPPVPLFEKVWSRAAAFQERRSVMGGPR